ncbi:hypothetical protein AA313_de0202468 [Arthrobotrys entomopaga]|nr:hypothetical protein AA313_de0202468 [Arthrobotrys entomopaga]
MQPGPFGEGARIVDCRILSINPINPSDRGTHTHKCLKDSKKSHKILKMNESDRLKKEWAETLDAMASFFKCKCRQTRMQTCKGSDVLVVQLGRFAVVHQESLSVQKKDGY